MEKVYKDIPPLNIGLNASDSSRPAFGIHIQRLNNNLYQKKMLESPHRNMFYEILFIKQGSGYQTIDFTRYPIQSNTFYFISEGQIQCWELSENVEGFTVFFTRDFYDLWSSDVSVFDFSFFHSSYLLPTLRLRDDSKVKVFENLFLTLDKEFAHPSDQHQDKILWSYLNVLLYKLQQNFKGNPQQHAQYAYQAIRNFDILVQKNFRQIRAVADYADMLHISPNYLNALCKKAEGKHAKEIINDRVLLEAKRLLYNSNKCITDIAFSLKFKDASYFSRFFRKGTGMSPEEFRMGYSQKVTE
ncbi:AraC family transcriptional regulator [Flexithrix dorotheae]|uniref:AraC family transcriptional regulator n=1 Tax=Flexithrix dorotheae TaxID=70993 RepID=UPI000377AFF9|nr:AraC family transcriptional regulator [Flexithrix dorotheae]